MSTTSTVILLDSSPTMNAPFPTDEDDHSSSTTRLECAKEAVIRMLGQIMMQGTKHLACVLVINSKTTEHKFKPDQYPNIVDLSDGCAGLIPPTCDLLRKIDAVQSTVNHVDDEDVRGDLMDGLLVAIDALRKTKTKKHTRRIVVVSDAAHKIYNDEDKMKQIELELGTLDQMEYRVDVLGLNFSRSGEFEPLRSLPPLSRSGPSNEEPSNEEPANESEEEEEEREEHDEVDEEEGEEDEEEEEEEESVSEADIKRITEEYLLTFVKHVGGRVKSASSAEELYGLTPVFKVPTSTRSKCELHIGPGLVVEIRFSLLVSESKIPSVKKQFIMVDENGKAKTNSAGELIVADTQRNVVHMDQGEEDKVLMDGEVTKAYMYGSDVVTFSALEEQRFTFQSERCIRILFYTKQSLIPRSFMAGNSYGLTGDKSTRACAAIGALANALYELKFAAVGTFVKTKNADPILIALFPLKEEGLMKPNRLFAVQLPYDLDVPDLGFGSLEELVDDDGSKAKAVNKMIDSLMLDSNHINSDQIGNPSVRAFNLFQLHRAVNDRAPIPKTRRTPPKDPMSTPASILERARPLLKSFRETFLLETVDSEAKKKRKKVFQSSYFNDFIRKRSKF